MTAVQHHRTRLFCFPVSIWLLRECYNRGFGKGFRKFIPFAKQILFNHLHYIDLYTACQCPNRGYLAKISYKLQIHVIVIPGSRAFVRERIDHNQRCEQDSPSKTSSRRKSICQGVEKIFTSARMGAGRDGISGATRPPAGPSTAMFMPAAIGSAAQNGRNAWMLVKKRR